MKEKQRNGRPATKTDQDEILEFMLETPPLELSESQGFSLSQKMRTSEDDSDDILDLDEDALFLADELDDGIIELSEPQEGAVDFNGDDVLRLKSEIPQATDDEEKILDFSGALDMSSDLEGEDILELDLEAPQTETVEEEILDLSEETPTASEPQIPSADLSGVPSGKEDQAGELLSDMDELLTLLSDDDSELDRGPKASSVPPQQAKDLVAEGFELGEALDDVIMKEMGSQTALAATIGTGLAVASPTGDSVERSDAGAAPVSTEQIEAAIERVVDRMLREKIDTLLAAAIERGLLREIDRLKRLLSDN